MIQTFSFTDKGPRAENQDFYCLEVLGGRLFAAVADGVGGNNGGEIASRFAINTVLENFHDGVGLSECLDSAHFGILKRAQADSELHGMATTLTAITCNGQSLSGVHCGDSRAYILRGKGLKQLTVDHTEVAKLLAEGKITKEEAIDYPRRNVLTSALGTNKDLTKQEFDFDILPGDRLLLLTDGVYSEISKREIQRMSAAEPELNIFCRNVLVALAAQGTTDNFTLVGVQFG